MKTLRFGFLALGALVFSSSGCTGEAFTSVEETGAVDAGADTGSDAAQAFDASEDAQDASNDVAADALDDAGTDGSADATADADAGEPDDGGGEGGNDDAGDAAHSDDAGDAAADAPDEDCVPVTWYQDQDVDEWGDDAVTIEACEPPSKNWAAKKGDCHDENPDVNPGQTAFFIRPFLKPGIVAEESYDYDCSGVEQANTSDMSSGTCKLTDELCTGSGYLEATPLRTGPGVNPYCGSDKYFTCTLLPMCSGKESTKPSVGCR